MRISDWSADVCSSDLVAKEGGEHGIRANVICPGFVRTPLVDKQIPEQAKELGISEDEVVKNVMLKDTVDGEFTTVDDVANVALISEEHTSELQSLMRISYAVFCLKKKKKTTMYTTY